MTAQTYLNSPVRSCATCIHNRPDTNLPDWPKFDYCQRWHSYSDISMRNYCGTDLREWRPIPPHPPRRSLRQWFHDTFLA